MRIKRFEAQDTKTALAMVKEEMGEDAVILATRALTTKGNGCTRVNGKGPVEVVAAMDYDLDTLASAFTTTSSVTNNKTQGYAHRNRTRETDTATGRHSAIATGNPASKPIAIGVPVGKSKPETLNSEAQNLRIRFSTLLKRQGAPVPATNRKQPLRQKASSPKRRSKPRPEDVEEWRNRLIDKLRIKPLTVDNRKGPTIIALVGATGVGKTTTAAKLAAWFSIHQGRKVTLLSMDCYRIGATDQLRTYAKIMRLPSEVVLRKKDLRGAVARHSDKDLIIIDTAGKSPYDSDHIRELEDWFNEVVVLKPFLVVSATAKKEDLERILKVYSPLEVEGLVVTKLDETRAYATLCQQLVTSSAPVSCLCTGQRVPEDFLPASKEFLSKLFGQGWPAVAGDLRTAAGIYS